MLYKEIDADLFSVGDDYWFAQCISADFAMGKGIAVEFNKKFDMKNKIRKTFPINAWDGKGYCRITSDVPVFNLITKENFFNKPTYQTLTQALEDMRAAAVSLSVKKIAMPVIGCGLDRLNWDRVKIIIQMVFQKTNIEILVCKYKKEE